MSKFLKYPVAIVVLLVVAFVVYDNVDSLYVGETKSTHFNREKLAKYLSKNIRYISAPAPLYMLRPGIYRESDESRIYLKIQYGIKGGRAFELGYDGTAIATWFYYNGNVRNLAAADGYFNGETLSILIDKIDRVTTESNFEYPSDH